jgi:hypothetical protein
MEKKTCKYCGGELSKVLIPQESDWGVEFFMICMNDECSYYVKGWDWMQEQYKVKASYRYKYDPSSDIEGPIPVKSPNDMKDWVVVEFNKV